MMRPQNEQKAQPRLESVVSPSWSSLLAIVPEDLERLLISPHEAAPRIVQIPVFPPFNYPPLPSSGYIRLLHLDPHSDRPSELRGSLRIHKLDAQCQYEAISYAWGDYPEFNKGLILDGQALKITGNLYAALMAYRYPNRTRVLWADAVCINQTDTAEKTQQIAIMADIYNKARTVQVWLAPASQWTSDAMTFMADVSSGSDTFGISKEVGQPREVESWPSVRISGAEAMDLFKDAISHHVDYLLARSWFNRVWVVQEVALAADLTVSCGHASMSWISFARALEVIRGAYRQIPLGEERSRLEGIKAAWTLVQLRDSFRMLDQRGEINHHRMTTLVGRQMYNKACADDRDRVYAMLAMTRSPYTIKPDYDKTVAEAYTEFTRCYSPNTQIFMAGLCRRQYHLNPGDEGFKANTAEQGVVDISSRDYLPSWVPDFRPELNLKWAWPFCGSYDTALRSIFWFLPHPKIPSVIDVSGTIFDMIGSTSWKFTAESSERTPYCAEEPGFYFWVVGLLQELAQPDPNFVFHPSTEPPWLILAKTLTGGVGDCEGADALLARYASFRGLDHLQQNSLAWLTTIWNCFADHCLAATGEVFQNMVLKARGADPKPLSADGKVAQGFMIYLANMLIPNRIFMTFGRYLGIAANDIQKGDFVAVFNGCHTPYVVRPAGKVKYKEEVPDKALQVIGPCYLHGIMQGEIFKNRNTSQFARLTWSRLDGDPVDSLNGAMLLV